MFLLACLRDAFGQWIWKGLISTCQHLTAEGRRPTGAEWRGLATTCQVLVYTLLQPEPRSAHISPQRSCHLGTVPCVRDAQSEAERASLTRPSHGAKKMQTLSRCVILLPL